MRLPSLVAHLPRIPIDLSRALSAVVLSALIYVFVANQTSAESDWQTPFTVPVGLVNVPAGLVATQQPAPVHVTLLATQQAYSQLQASSFTAQIDASNATVGVNQLPIVVRTTDSNVSDVSADPAEMSVQLEQIEQRDLPVQVQLSGQVPPGYQAGQATPNPGTVTVTGPSSVVQQATDALINVDVAGATISVNGAYTTTIVDAQGERVTDPSLKIMPPSVSVQVPITQITQYKQVGIQPMTQGVPAAGYVVDSITVDPPAVTLVGSAAGLASESVVQTQPIDVSGANTTLVRQVGLTAPSGALLLQPDQSITATVHLIPVQLTEPLRITPSVINASPNIALAQPPAAVTLTITGPAPNLSTLGSSDLQVTLDATGKGPGQYTITPQVQNLPPGVSLDSINPQQVTVTLVSAPPAA